MKKKKKIEFDNRWKILSFSLIVIFAGIWYSNKKANHDLIFQENKETTGYLEAMEKSEEPKQKIQLQSEPPAVTQEIEQSSESSIPQEEILQEAEQPEETADGKININTATAAELDSLPGIGEALSKSIIEYREEKGGFQSIEELKDIDRIGEKTFEKLKDKIKI